MRYSKAPITEATIDIHVQPKTGKTLDDLAYCYQSERLAYPNQKDLKRATALFEVGPQISASTISEKHGFIFSSGNQKQIIQVRRDGFVYSRLAPYESWSDFSSEARRLWRHYRECLSPERVTRIAVRYINRFDIPGEQIELRDYLATSPEIAKGLPLPMEGFFLQVRMSVKDLRASLLINETIVAPPVPGMISIVLDIDLFRVDDLPQEEKEIWGLLEQFRTRKNDIFEACITDKIRELII